MPESEYNGGELIVSSSSLADGQIDILRDMLRSDAAPQAILPEGCNAQHFWDRLDVLSKALSGAKILEIRLRPLLGRILLLAQQNPEYYTSRGFRSFDKFVESLRIFGIKRSTAYHAKNTAERMPSLTPSEFEAIGVEKANVLVRFTDDSKPSFREHYERALSMSVDDFTRDAEKRGLINPGEADQGVIKIYTTQEIKEHWDDFASGILAQNKCTTADHGVILLHTIQEASSSWANKNLDLLIFNPVVRDAVDAFTNDYRIHNLFGTTDKDTILIGALAKCMNLVTGIGETIDV